MKVEIKSKMSKIIETRSIPRILKELKRTYEINEVKRLQDTIIAGIISILCASSSAMYLCFGYYAKHDMASVLYQSIMLLIMSLYFDYIAFNVVNNALRIQLLSLGVVIIEVFVVVYLYQYLGPAIWTFGCLFLLISIIRLDQMMFLFIGLSDFLILIYLSKTYLNQTLTLNIDYYLVQLFLFLLILTIGLLWSRVYQSNYIKSFKQYKDTIKKNEEISQLYEEVVATDLELRRQNELLARYNFEIRQNEKKLNHIAYHDSLTNLPNRINLIKEIDRMISHDPLMNEQFAIIFFDLDGFKMINDLMGHHMGDLYLQEISKVLLPLLKKGDILGRFGGDEFAILTKNFDSDVALSSFTNEIREALCKEVSVDNHIISSSASFGIAVYPDHGKNRNELLISADAAMYQAKEYGRNCIQLFSKKIGDKLTRQIELENALKNSLVRNEFSLVYQPQKCLKSGKIFGVEALLRWKSIHLGNIYPDVFIPLLEKSRMIIPVGNWVIEESCKLIVKLKDTGLCCDGFKVSANISPIQLTDESFARNVEAIIQRFSILPSCLKLEVTESSFIENEIVAITQLMKLREIGVGLALDDFGTGYASLSYLTKLPIDTLKIDRAFIWKLHESESDRKMIGAIISIAHELGMEVLAEGVENDYQMSLVSRKGCDAAQGYFISEPLEFIELYRFMRRLL